MSAECPHGDDPSKRCRSGRHVLAEVGVYRRPDTGHVRCRGCMALVEANRVRTWRRTPEQNRAKHLMRSFGLTLADFDRMVDEQDGLCLICEKQPKLLVVDHDHRCCPGKTTCGNCIRGLLCPPCNTLVGRIENGSLAKFHAYIEEHLR